MICCNGDPKISCQLLRRDIELGTKQGSGRRNAVVAYSICARASPSSLRLESCRADDHFFIVGRTCGVVIGLGWSARTT